MLAQMQEMRRQLQASQQREAQKKVHDGVCVHEHPKRNVPDCERFCSQLIPAWLDASAAGSVAWSCNVMSMARHLPR